MLGIRFMQCYLHFIRSEWKALSNRLICVKRISLVFIIIQAYLCLCINATCNYPPSDLNSFSRYQESYGVGTGPYIYQVKTGTQSTNIYYLEWITSPNSVIIRKTDSLDNSLWIASYGSFPNSKSLVIDSNEIYFYYCLFQSPLVVLKLFASTGGIAQATQL